MTIKEMEECSGMERSNIRFYEKEGLILPARQENGYRDYSEEDLQMLLRIKLLRSLHISLEEIKELQGGQEALVEVMERQMVQLEQEREGLAAAKTICANMRKDGTVFSKLDAERYLGELRAAVEEQEPLLPGERAAVRREEGAEKENYSAWKYDYERLPFCPWRRFLARTFDLLFYAFILRVVYGLVFHVNLLYQNTTIIDILAACFLMAVLEPLFLHFFRTTPGKWIFGITLGHSSGRGLTYKEGFERTVKVLCFGMGFQLPPLNLVLFSKSYQAYEKDEFLPWEEGGIQEYSFRDVKNVRFAVYLAAVLLILAVNTGLLLSQLVAPNRGPLTVAELAENVNYYARYFHVGRGVDYRMTEKGQWEKYPLYKYILNEDELEKLSTPKYSHVLNKGGNIQEVSFCIGFQTKNDGVIGDFREYESLLLLGYSGAKMPLSSFLGICLKSLREPSVFRGLDERIRNTGVYIKETREMDGYRKADGMNLYLAEQEGAEKSFWMEFHLR